MLHAVRKDPKLRIETFYTQQDAFDHADKQALRLKVWSNEIDSSGKRRYLTGSYEAFWRFYSRCLRRSNTLHFYEVIREQRASKLYFDLEFKREQNDCNCERMIDALIDSVAKLACIPIRRHTEDVVELDSTTEVKFSRHIVFEHVAFYDNVHAGLFAHKVVQKLQEQNENLVMVNKDERKIPFVDLGVYTKNRCFRIVASSKFGKTARLLPLNHEGDRVSISKGLFLKSLVCSVRKGVSLRGNPSPLQSMAKVERENPYSAAETPRFKREKASLHPQVDKYVYSIIEPLGGGIHGVTISGEHLLVYAIKGGYKYCANVGRHHKSNNVLLIADMGSKCMYQKCFDPDCRGFRSLSWPMPPWITDEIGDDDLLRVVDEIEDAGGGISDNALSAVLDNHLNKNPPHPL